MLGFQWKVPDLFTESHYEFLNVWGVFGQVAKNLTEEQQDLSLLLMIVKAQNIQLIEPVLGNLIGL